MQLFSGVQWFYYAQEQQVGPMAENQIAQLIQAGHLGKDDYLYREGFEDWKHVKDVPEFQKYLMKTPPPPPQAKKEGAKGQSGGGAENRKAPRAKMTELVVAHNGVKMTTGSIFDISATGLFLETKQNYFKVNEEVKIILKEGRGLGKPLQVNARVVRYCSEAKPAIGYAFELCNIDNEVKERIEDYVKRNMAS